MLLLIAESMKKIRKEKRFEGIIHTKETDNHVGINEKVTILEKITTMITMDTEETTIMIKIMDIMIMIANDRPPLTRTSF